MELYIYYKYYTIGHEDAHRLNAITTLVEKCLQVTKHRSGGRLIGINYRVVYGDQSDGS